MMKSIFNIQERATVDDSIRSYQYVEYQPITGTQLNMPGEITITIENTDDFHHPRQSYLVVEGSLVKEDGTRYADADEITLTHNGIMHLFSNMKYSLSGMEIESINHPGPASTILGSIKYTPDIQKGSGLMQCWYPDTAPAADRVANTGFGVRQAYIIQAPNPKGQFSCMIPAEHLFGFCEDYDKAMYGVRHQLTLVRKTADSDAIFKAAATVDGKVVLTKISWMMPKVVPNDAEKYALYKQIEAKNVFDVRFRRRQCSIIEIPQATSMQWRVSVKTVPEQPRWIIVGIQTDKRGNQAHNASLFDHCNVTNMSIVLNSERYPLLNANADFAKYKFASFYKAMSEFLPKYYGMDPLVGNACISPSSYHDLYPLYVFDVSKQSERLDTGVVDVTVDMQFSANVPAQTCAYAVVLSDRHIKLQSDGKKMNVVF